MELLELDSLEGESDVLEDVVLLGDEERAAFDDGDDDED